MDPLSLVAACALILQPTSEGLRCSTLLSQSAAPNQRQNLSGDRKSGTAKWQTEIAQASARFHLPEAWVGAVMGAESGGRTTLNGRPITSSAGAMGLMQLMPDTYDDMRQRYGLGADPHDPHDNILAGTAYLRQMYERYGYPNLFGAYNAGPGRFDTYLKTGKQLPSETRAYVGKILPGVRLETEIPSSDLSPKTSVSTLRNIKSGASRALFFVQFDTKGASKNREVTPPTRPKNARSEAALFVPLSGDLHKPEN